MLTFTDAARSMVREFMDQGYMESPVLRIGLVPGSSPLAPEWEFTLVEAWEQEDGDAVVDTGAFLVYADAAAAPALEGSTIDFLERGEERGFEVRNPRLQQPGAAAPSGPLAERVHQVIEEQINPGVAAHGGKITLVDVRENVAFIEMSGGCHGCGMAKVTLRQGVERMIKQAVPEIVGVEDVTDHVSGENPYYARH